uniref:Uncharacterized protein n=1 Tax=Astyanax mexicanus TaxID=7994 RepID=A0A3B1JXC4_ASTMX
YRGRRGKVLTRCQSGRDMSLKTWQVLVVTEVAPIHHTREKSQRSCTPQRLMETFSFRRFLQTLQSQRSCLCMPGRGCKILQHSPDFCSTLVVQV